MACVLVLAFAGWHGTIGGACFGAGKQAGVDEGEENVPDMNFPQTNLPPGVAAQTNTTWVGRVDTLAATDVVLQEVKPAFGPSSESR